MKQETGQGGWLRPLLCGAAVGALGIAPGVSGGVLAASLGYYELLLFAAAHPLKALKERRQTLLPLLLGLFGGVVLFGRVMLELFARFPCAARYTVAGLIVGTLPSAAAAVLKTRDDGGEKRLSSKILFVAKAGIALAVGVSLGLWLFYGRIFPQIGAELSFREWVLCGGVQAFGTVVPGVSASCILLSMNGYEAVLALIAGREPAGVLPFFLGFCGVAASLVCIVNCLYTRYERLARAVVLGLVAASVFPVIPPLSAGKSGVVAVLCGLWGLALTCQPDWRHNCKAKRLYTEKSSAVGRISVQCGAQTKSATKNAVDAKGS